MIIRIWAFFRKFRWPQPFVRGNGFVLIELVIAISLTALILGILFSSWQFILKHTARQKREALFFTSSSLFANKIITEIKRSALLTNWSSNKIELIGSNKTDTIVFDFSGSKLFRNNIEVSDDKIRLKNFEIGSNHDIDIFEATGILLDITFSFENDFGDSGVFTYTVNLQSTDEIKNKEETFGFWNFP